MPAPPALEAPAEGLALAVDGWSAKLGAKAQLNVTEGLRTVRLEITGSIASDVLMLDVAFEGIEDSMGPHQLEVGLPGTELDSALASIDGQSYQSQGGRITLSLTADGSIYGDFELELAEVADAALGQPIAFEVGETVRTLSGRFNGEWELFCQSHLPGHNSALQRGGHYCDALVIE